MYLLARVGALIRLHRLTMDAPEPDQLVKVRPADHTERSEHSERSSEPSEALSDHCAHCFGGSMKADSAYGKRMLRVESEQI